MKKYSVIEIRALNELHDQLKRDIAAVERVLEIAKSRGASTGVSPNPPAEKKAEPRAPRQNGESKYGSVSRAVNRALESCSEQFTASDVLAALDKQGSHGLDPYRVYVVLKRLSSANKIEVVKPKYGRTPAIYKKKM